MKYIFAFSLISMISMLAQADVTVATVNGEAIKESDVIAHLRPAGIRLGVEPLPDARQVALKEALKVRLFAAEARKLGIEPPEGSLSMQQSFLHQAYIKYIASKNNLSKDVVTDDQAREYFNQYRHKLLKLSEVTVQAIVVNDAKLADELLIKAAKSNYQEFGELAQNYSQKYTENDAGLLGTFKHNHKDFDSQFDDDIVRAAYRLTQPGMVALVPVKNTDFYILRGDAPQFVSRNWDDEFALYMRNAVAYEKRQKYLEDSYVRLRAEADITIDSDALSNIPSTSP